MDKYLGKYVEPTYALLRIVAGFLFACHGAQKMLGLFGGMDGDGGTAELASKIGLAGSIELFAGLAIALGVVTAWAAFLSSGLMAVAYFTAHQPQGALPILNQGDLAAVYSFLFLYIATRGPGIWSLGARIKKS